MRAKVVKKAKVIKKAVVKKEIFYCRGISPAIKKFVADRAKERGVSISYYLEHLLGVVKMQHDAKEKRRKQKKLTTRK